MSRLTHFIIFLTLAAAAISQYVPPSIIVGPPQAPTYIGSYLELKCLASGMPNIRYDWLVDGLSLAMSANRATHNTTTGVLTVLGPVSGAFPEGYYQCTASVSNYGTALSNSTRVVIIKLDANPGSPESSYTREMGQAFAMPCDTSRVTIVPKANYKWQLVADRVTRVSADITPDSRLQIDENGTLHFAYVLLSDSQGGFYYRCNLINTENNDKELSTSYTKLFVTPSSKGDPTAMSLLFSSPSPTIGLAGQSVVLQCFFGGRKDISVRWTKGDGSQITDPRFIPGGQRDSGKLTINNVQQSDEGDYQCTGSHRALSPLSQKIRLTVRVIPYFAKVTDQPRDINKTIGDNVTINCNTVAIPDATVVWLRNGVPITAPLARKYTLSADKKTLTISSLCKRCFDEGDLGVIQCNASNEHGYILGQGYINVLEPTMIRTPLPNTTLDYPNPIHYTCRASFDPITPVTYSWTFEGHPITDGRVNTSSQGELYIDISQDGGHGKDFRGTWQCIASNGVSQDVATAILRESPVPEASKDLPSWWWIPLVVLLLLLLLAILLIVLCCCLYRNRGNSYPVDEKERKGGNDPEKDLSDSGFHDYQRPDDKIDGHTIPETGNEIPRSRGPGSVNSSIMKTGSDDEMSLNDYSNINPGKFTEDGSFIGQYNPRQRTEDTRPPHFESKA